MMLGTTNIKLQFIASQRDVEAQEEIWNMWNSEIEEVSAEPIYLSGKKNGKNFTLPLRILHVRFQHFT